MKERDRHRQIETPRTGAPRIYEKDAAFFRTGRHMRMSAHDDVETRGGGIEIERVNVVQDVHRKRIRLDDFGFGKRLRPRVRIDISAHGKNGSDGFQCLENFGIAHVARMNDQVRAFERTQSLRAQQSMRV